MLITEYNEFTAKVSHAILEALRTSQYAQQLQVPLLREAIELYIKRGGKRMRPSLLAIAYLMFGGDNVFEVSPACLGLELYHCWTLVHDDIIDNDSLRRGDATVHAYFTEVDSLPEPINQQSLEVRELFGRDVAIFTGDLIHAWAIDSFLTQTEWGDKYIPSVIRILQQLERKTVCALADGEIIDRMLTYKNWNELAEAEILNMLELKTARLLQFSGYAGAILADPTLADNHPQLVALNEYLRKIGLVFQLQDDILGAFGSEEKLGKPIGSDFREGKRTQLLFYTWHLANSQQRYQLEQLLGKPDLSTDEVETIKQIVIDSGAKERCEEYIQSLVTQAQVHLELLPANQFRDLLSIWSDKVISREN